MKNRSEYYFAFLWIDTKMVLQQGCKTIQMGLKGRFNGLPLTFALDPNQESRRQPKMSQSVSFLPVKRANTGLFMPANAPQLPEYARLARLYFM